MRIVMEWSDVLRMLSNHLGRELDEGNVTISTEPFEIEVRGIGGIEDLKSASPRPAQVMPDPVSTEETTEGVSRTRGGGGEDIYSTLQQAKEIERELKRMNRVI